MPVKALFGHVYIIDCNRQEINSRNTSEALHVQIKVRFLKDGAAGWSVSEIQNQWFKKLAPFSSPTYHN